MLSLHQPGFSKEQQQKESVAEKGRGLAVKGKAWLDGEGRGGSRAGRGEPPSLFQRLVKRQQLPLALKSLAVSSLWSYTVYGRTHSLWSYTQSMVAHTVYGWSQSMVVPTVYGCTHSLWSYTVYGHTHSLWSYTQSIVVHTVYGCTHSLWSYTVYGRTHSLWLYTQSMVIEMKGGRANRPVE